MNTLHHASRGGEAKSVIFDFTNSFSARPLDSRKILGGFMFAYDGTDNANIIINNGGVKKTGIAYRISVNERIAGSVGVPCFIAA